MQIVLHIFTGDFEIAYRGKNMGFSFGKILIRNGEKFQTSQKRENACLVFSEGD